MGAVVGFWLRCFSGVLTRLPVSPDYSESAADFPSAVHTSFFFFYSGHACLTIQVMFLLWEHGHKNQVLFVHVPSYLWQSVRLLATRGHYSIDLVYGFYVGCVMVHVRHWVNDTLEKINTRESTFFK